VVKSGPLNTERYPELFAGYTIVPTAKKAYVQRLETIRLTSLSDPKKKIASVRESTISPVIASSPD